MDLGKVKSNYIRQELLDCSKLASWTAIFVGALVVVGWLCNVELLIKINSNWTAMVANTALCFILAGFSIISLQKKLKGNKENGEKFSLSAALALTFGLFAFLTGIQYFLRVDFGIDHLLIPQQLLLKNHYSGRMALNTSICFVLLSAAIVVAQSGKAIGILLSQMLAVAIYTISLIALVGYLYGTFNFYGIEGYSSMAVHTAALFFLLSLGVLAIFPGRGLTRFVGRDPQTARLGMNFLMAVLFIPVFFGWLWLQGQNRGTYSLQFGVSLMVVFNLIFLATIVWLFLDKLCSVSSQRNEALKTVNELNSNLEDKIKKRTDSLEKLVSILQAANDRFNSVMSTASDAIICADENGEIILWNYAAEKMFGYNVDEIAGKPLTYLIPQRFYEAHVKAFAKSIEARYTPTFKKPTELIALRKDGSEFPIELSLSSWNASGLKYFTGMIRDITNRKDAEKKIAEQQKSMVHLSRMQAFGQLAGGLAHEMNTPLGVIYLQAPRLRSDILEGRIEKAMIGLDSIENMATRISGIVKSLMQFSQDSSDDSPSVINMNDLVDQALSFCNEKFRRANIKIKIESSDSLLNVTCRGTDLTQAILNLLLNSFDAIKGTNFPWIHIKLARSGKSVVVSITDSGNGIPGELQERIMEPFFTTKNVGAGMGLGLSVTKGIIESHDGHIIIDRESPNTKFILEVPFQEGDENAF